MLSEDKIAFFRDDLVTALLMIDEVTEENGPLGVWPGTHRGALHDLWRGDRFTGAVDEVFARTRRFRLFDAHALAAWFGRAWQGNRPRPLDAIRRYENLSQAAWRDIPKTPPMAFRLIPRFRNTSICVCSTVRVASTVATGPSAHLSNRAV